MVSDIGQGETENVPATGKGLAHPMPHRHIAASTAR
jgi:hypothetical protein